MNNVEANEIKPEFLNITVKQYCETVFVVNYTNGSDKVIFTIQHTSTDDEDLQEEILTDTWDRIDKFVDAIKTANRDNFLKRIQELSPSINTGEKTNDAPVVTDTVGEEGQSTDPADNAPRASNHGTQNIDDIDGTQWTNYTQCDENDQLSISSMEFESSKSNDYDLHAHQNVIRMYQMIEELINNITHRYNTSTAHVDNDHDQLDLPLNHHVPILVCKLSHLTQNVHLLVKENEQVKDSFEAMMTHQSHMNGTQLELEKQLHDL